MELKDPNEKDPRRQLMGKVAKAMGKQFEERLDQTFAYYEERGDAFVEKASPVFTKGV